ncbi:MAG: class 1 fructose-bisphosphatase [Moraxellaceae bacterium]|nr:class 1 fructose-bisphosphatase [Moraxellaceae bacterium]
MQLIDYLNTKTTDSNLISTIHSIADASVKITALLRQGALAEAEIHGEAGNQNVQGEEQKKLDVIANDLLLETLSKEPHCAGVASEELDDATATHPNGEHLVLFDPLDGSSNIEINMSVGTIFSILPYHRQGEIVTNEDFLQTGHNQLASGYIMYGTSSILMLTIGKGQGVAMFVLNPKTGEYLLHHDDIRITKGTQEYAINSSNYRQWFPAIQKYVDELIAGETGIRGKNYNTRWVAAMVSEVNRILTRGGVFLYPADKRNVSQGGKLRLMYEANPMALLIEEAGGKATDTVHDILDIEPTHIHQRISVVLGCPEEVERVRELHLA